MAQKRRSLDVLRQPYKAPKSASKGMTHDKRIILLGVVKGDSMVW
jgi:hypothetical protein